MGGLDPPLPVGEGALGLGVDDPGEEHVGLAGGVVDLVVDGDHERPLQGLFGQLAGPVVAHEVDPGQHQHPELAGGRGRDHGRPVQPRPVGELGPPGLGQLPTGAGVADRPPAGQQPGPGADIQGAAVAGPPWHPGEPAAEPLGQPGRRGQPAGGPAPPPGEDDDVALALGDQPAGVPVAPAQPLQGLGLAARLGGDDGGELGQPPRPGPDRDHRHAPAPGRLAQPEPEDGRLLVRVEVDDHDRPGRLQVLVGRHPVVRAAPGHAGGGRRPGLVLGPGAGVDVVGAKRHPGQLLQGVGVLVGEVAADQHPHPPGPGRPDAVGGPAQRLRPGGGPQLAVLGQVRDQHPLGGLGVGEAVAAPVAVPGLVDLVVVAGELAGDHAPAGVDAQVAAGGAVVADPVGRGQVERPGLEPVGRRGQGPDRADLDHVAGEGALVRLVLVDGHLLQGPALEQLDERVAGDLAGEAGAAGAEHAALPVQQHRLGDLDRLLVAALGLDEARLPRPVGQGLVLERALAALVAHGAVERVVDQQQLEVALLAGPGHLGGELGLDHHAVGHRGGAGGQRLALAGHLDQALAAGAQGGEQPVVAEAGDDRAQLLGGADHQRARGDLELGVVDGDLHGGRLVGHGAPGGRGAQG